MQTYRSIEVDGIEEPGEEEGEIFEAKKEDTVV